MPNILCGRPLKFGDPEQIEYINTMEELAREKAARDQLVSDGKLKRYRIVVHVVKNYTSDVQAVDEKHAEELALKEHGIRSIDAEDVEVYER